MGLTRWYNEGLFLTYGPEHHRQRDELWNPLFDDSQVTDIAVERTSKLADSSSTSPCACSRPCGASSG